MTCCQRQSKRESFPQYFVTPHRTAERYDVSFPVLDIHFYVGWLLSGLVKLSLILYGGINGLIYVYLNQSETQHSPDVNGLV